MAHDELVRREAVGALRPHVGTLWGYAHCTAGPARRQEPLSTGVVLIVGLGPELRLADHRHPTRPAVPVGSFVAGLDDACTVIEHDGELRGIQVDLSPTAARAMFRVPMHALARRVVALEDLLGAEAHRLEERVLEAATWEERFALVEGVLAARLAAAPPPPADVEWCRRRLVETQGRARVDELAADLRCSRKHLAARFREHVGLPPKLVARMLRFRRALDLLVATPPPTVAAVAAACGYFDQSHLDRDFRHFAGTTPTAFVAGR